MRGTGEREPHPCAAPSCSVLSAVFAWSSLSTQLDTKAGRKEVGNGCWSEQPIRVCFSRSEDVRRGNPRTSWMSGSDLRPETLKRVGTNLSWGQLDQGLAPQRTPRTELTWPVQADMFLTYTRFDLWFCLQACSE